LRESLYIIQNQDAILFLNFISALPQQDLRQLGTRAAS